MGQRIQTNDGVFLHKTLQNRKDSWMRSWCGCFRHQSVVGGRVLCRKHLGVVFTRLR